MHLGPYTPCSGDVHAHGQLGINIPTWWDEMYNETLTRRFFL